MRVIFAVDESAKQAYTNHLPGCLKWAQERTEATGNPVKIVACRGGERHGKTVAEVTTDGVRPIQSGTLWHRKKLESMHVEQ